MNDMNKGCGCSTVEEYSGWNCVPIYQRFSGISTISTRSAVRIYAHALHTGRLVLVAVLVVELIAVAVALTNDSLTPDPSPKGEGSR